MPCWRPGLDGSNQLEGLVMVLHLRRGGVGLPFGYVLFFPVGFKGNLSQLELVFFLLQRA